MKTNPLRPIRATADGVGISVEYINEVISRIEDLVETAQRQKPIAGNNIEVNFTGDGAVIKAAD
jgi:hypothetical protein